MNQIDASPGAGAQAPVGGWWRRRRSLIVIGAGLIAATTLAILGSPGSAYSGAIDPENSDPDGARAVARVLVDQGVDVDIVRDAESLTAARADASSTVVVTGAENLGKSTVRDLLAGDQAEVIVVDPPPGVADLFDAEVAISYSRGREVNAECLDDRFDGLRLATREGAAFSASPNACFPVSGGALLSQPQPRVSVLGAADLLSNEQIREAENAAIALRLLGQRPRVVWYVPDPGDLTGADGVSLRSLLPDWIGPGLLLTSISVLALIYWRGRRLGPLAVEPLPVAVTAIETTRSRGRLYRKANARGHAAQALRTAARSELVEHLLLPRGTVHDVALLVRLVEPHTPRAQSQIHALLSNDGPAPGSDQELITLANDLAELSREVRHS